MLKSYRRDTASQLDLMNINGTKFTDNSILQRTNSWPQEPSAKNQSNNLQDNPGKPVKPAGVLYTPSDESNTKKTFEKNKYLPELTRGGTAVVGGVLQRLHSLASRAANPALTEEERDSLNTEFLRTRAQIYQLEDTLRINTARLDSPSVSQTVVSSLTSAIRGLSQPGQILNIVA